MRIPATVVLLLTALMARTVVAAAPDTPGPAPDRAQVFVFHEHALNRKIYNLVSLDGDDPLRLGQGSYLSLTVAPGSHVMYTMEKTSRGRLSARDRAMAPGIDDPVAALKLDLAPGSVTYVGVGADFAAYRYECRADREFAQICSKTLRQPTLELVPGPAGRARVEGLRLSAGDKLRFSSRRGGESDYAPYRTLPAGSTIRLIAAGDVAASADAQTRRETAGAESRRQAGSLAGKSALGGLQAGAEMCGPFLIICSPAFALVGAGGGAVVGGIRGSLEGGRRGLSDEQAIAFEAVAAEVIEDSEAAGRLQAHLIEQSAGFWAYDASEPEVVAEVRLESVSPGHSIDARLSLTIVTSITLAYADAPGKFTRRFLFEHESDAAHVDAWLADEGTAIRDALDAAYRATTRDMIDALRP